MDVLENIDDDVEFLKSIVSKAPSGTVFIVSVPAFNFLWSEHDIFLEHKRRYCIGDISDVIKKSNSQMKQSFYFYVFFQWRQKSACSKKLQYNKNTKSDLKIYTPLINKILYKSYSCENFVKNTIDFWD